MNRALLSLAVVFSSLLAPSAALSQSPYMDAYEKRYGSPQPYSNRSRGGGGGHHGGGHHHHHGGLPNYIYSPYPYYGGYYGPSYYPYGGYYGGYTYPYYLDIEGSRLGPYVAPPAYLNYPQAVVPPLVNNVPPQVTNRTIIVAPPAEEKAPREVRQSNATSKALAAKNIAIGDDLFAKQSYSSAFSRYKSAAQAAPDVAEAYFRQGHALVALGRYELAAQLYRRALNLDPRAPLPEPQLEQLYADGNLAKIGHRENLAEALAEDPKNADLLFVLGVNLYMDGEQERALTFLQRSYDLLSPEERGHLSPFLGEGDKPVGVDI